MSLSESLAVKGALNNYIRGQNFAIFDPLPLGGHGCYTLSVEKTRHFLTPSPPHLVHALIEWLLRHITESKQGDH